MKALLSVIVLLVCLTFIACDGDDSCIPNRELELSTCVAEDLLQACHRYFCEEVAAANGPAIVPPDSFGGEECFVTGCKTIFCTFVGYTDLEIRNVNGFPGIFGVFFTDVLDQEPIEFGPCEFE